MPTYAELTASINALVPQVVAACPSGGTCGTLSAQLATMRDQQRQAEESEYNANALDAARRAAGLKPGEAIPDKFATPITMDFTRLASPEARAAAVLRADAMRTKLAANIANARLEVERAKASVRLPAGTVMTVQGGCPDGWRDEPLTCFLDLRTHTYCDTNWNWNDGGYCHTSGNGGPRSMTKLGCGGHQDQVDGLCYNKCPASHPHHIEGMPYLCAHSTHAYDAIKDQATYDFISKDDTEAALACAEATLAKDRGRIEEKCGFDAKAKWKAIGEKMATGLVSFASMGLSDILGAIDKKLDANKGIFGHENRGGAGGAATQHIDGVIKAIIDLKDLGTEEACVAAIDAKDMIGYMKYCPLYKEAPKPWAEAKDASGNLIKDETGKQVYIDTVPIIPPDVDFGTDADWTPAGTYPQWDVPDVPGFDESKLPVYPPELLAAIPESEFPVIEKPDMVPSVYPIDLKINPTNPMKPASLPPGAMGNWNIAERPNVIMAFGLAAILILAI